VLEPVRHPRARAVRHGRHRPRAARSPRSITGGPHPARSGHRRRTGDNREPTEGEPPWRDVLRRRRRPVPDPGRKVAVIGYGSQGHAHALNLRDSGVDVRVGLPEGSKSRAKAEAEGLRVLTPPRRRRGRRHHDPRARHRAADALREDIEPNLSTATRCSSPRLQHPLRHISRPPASTCMVAPKGPATSCAAPTSRGRRRAVPHRRRAGRVRQGARPRAVLRRRPSAAPAPACIETTFTEETETDLFGEQAVLCGGRHRAGAGRLRDARRGRLPARVAYFECLHELKLIVDLMYEGGIAKHALLDLRHRRVRRLRSRGRVLGTSVNVVSPLRWLHSLVTDRIARSSAGSPIVIGKPIAPAKCRR
jgi:hypothetical protein